MTATGADWQSAPIWAVFYYDDPTSDPHVGSLHASREGAICELLSVWDDVNIFLRHPRRVGRDPSLVEEQRETFSGELRWEKLGFVAELDVLP